MRSILSDGDVNASILLYVGRLGLEKRVDRLKAVLDENPSVRLAIVGAGPYEKELRKLFKDNKVHFAGPLVGKPDGAVELILAL
jgi:glycosyltransferase involved in cell wall biosynthesis